MAYFCEAVDGLNLKKLFQISTDGPSVNKIFSKELKVKLRVAYVDGTALLDLVSCGLHSVHNAYKTSMKKNDWKIVEFLTHQ